MSAIKLEKFCNKCEINRIFRFVKSSRVRDNVGYFSCATCLKKNSKKHRKTHWCRYLAQKANARKRKDSVKLTEEDLKILMENQKGKCALTGVSFCLDYEWNRSSLDRIDNNKGYCISNIRLVTWIVNHIRRNLTDNEFVRTCKLVTEYDQQKIVRELV